MINHLFLPVEFRYRELDSRLLIALSVISKKTNTLKVFIGERESLEKYKKGLDNKKMNNIVVHKGLISDLYYFYQLYKSNTLLVILDEEGGVYSNFIKNGWPRGGKNNLYWKYVSCVFFWGVEAKNFYIKYNQNLQGIDNIVSGNPRFDLPKINFDKNDKFKKILINLNFSRLNNIVNFEKEIEYRKSINTNSNFEDKLSFFYEFQKSIFDIVIEMIKYLSTNNKKYNFIIRPHLVENNQTYIDIFKNYKNIYVDNNISVADHLDNTKCVIHTGCTTAAEAYFGKVPSIIFIPNKQYLNAIPDILKKISIRANNKFEVNTYLRKIIKESDFFFNRKKDDSLNNIIFNVNNFSYEIIGNKLLNIFENFQTYKMKNSFFFQYICSFVMVFQKLKRLFYIYTNLRNAKIYKPNEIIFRDKLKFPEISLKDMQKKVNKYSKFPGISKNNISIKKVGKNIFELS